MNGGVVVFKREGVVDVNVTLSSYDNFALTTYFWGVDADGVFIAISFWVSNFEWR